MLRRRARVLPLRWRDRKVSSFCGGPVYPLRGLELAPLPLDALVQRESRLLAVSDLYLDHRFDLLGSGWVQVRHGMECAGLEGFRHQADPIAQSDRRGDWLASLIDPVNFADSARIWRLLEGDYCPIDWQLDFKSGYRWSERTWYLDITYGDRLGADVKVPWELSRMQHLVQLAWCYGLARHRAKPELAERCRREFRNQVLDFIATNPPRFGVNWACPMDVAIRAANWILAFSALRQFGVQWDQPFEAELSASLCHHARHIVANLEWAPQVRGNHYLSDISGLLVIAAALAPGTETNAWLAFAVAQLFDEIRYQFNSEGSNFEASTSYHRLSAEMAAYATAVVLGLPAQRRGELSRYVPDPRIAPPRPVERPSSTQVAGALEVPAEVIERLAGMASFSADLTKPNGLIVQIGDNDSGRFFKVEPPARESAAASLEQLDHKHLRSAIAALFDAQDSAVDSSGLDAWTIRCLAGNVSLPADVLRRRAQSHVRSVGAAEGWARLREQAHRTTGDRGNLLTLTFPGAGLRQDLALCAYPQFGAYIFRSPRLFLAIRCGPVGQLGQGGHAHNDQLALEISIDGRDFIVDHGTYLYTPVPELRNQYRGVQCHFAPRLEGEEPASLKQGLFRLGRDPDAECLFFGSEGFVGRHRGYGSALYRLVEVGDQRLTIIDYFDEATSGRPVTPSFEQWRDRVAAIGFSPGYGIRFPGCIDVAAA